MTLLAVVPSDGGVDGTDELSVGGGDATPQHCGSSRARFRIRARLESDDAGKAGSGDKIKE
jgi:hypothetical protein